MKNHHLTVFLLLSFFTSGCATLYLPSALDVPMHTNAKEFQAAGYAGIDGFEVHTSYSITQHFAAGLNGTIIDKKDYYGDRNYHRLFEVRTSYFTTFGAMNAGRIDLKLGYGRGAVYEESAKFANYRIATNYNRFTLTPFIGRATGYVEGGIAPRLTFIKYSNPDPGAEPIIPYLEPMGLVKMGPPGFKVIAQCGLSLPLTLNNAWMWRYKPAIVTLGIEMKLGLHER